MTKKIIDRLIIMLFPQYLIPKRSWQEIWNARERKAYLLSSRVFCVAFATIYALHYPLVDIPAKKEPITLWAFYRFSVALAGLLAFGLSFTGISNRKFSFRLPALLATTYMVFMQGQSMIWREQIPFFYVPVFAFIGTLCLRLPVGGSVFAYGFILACSYQSFIARAQDTQHMVSMSIVGALMLIFFRHRVKNDIENFVLENEFKDVQKRIIEQQIEFNDQIKSFLPKMLYLRVENQIKTFRKTPSQAIDDVLRPNACFSAILHTDIRGFTSLTKQGDIAVLSAIIPAQKKCTDAVEKFSGIPRLQGDLVYAYFDNQDPILNIVGAIRSAFEIYRISKSLNNVISIRHKITRYVILTFGKVIVGNLGGTEGSRDISVIGNAANLPSRIDLITKEEKIKPFLKDNPIILAKDAKSIVEALFPQLIFKEIALDELDINLRDFEEEKLIYILEANDLNQKIVFDDENIFPANIKFDLVRGIFEIQPSYSGRIAA